MNLSKWFVMPAGRASAVPLTASPARQPSPGLDQILERLRIFVESGEPCDPDLLVAARLLCKTAESLARLGLRVQNCLESGECHPEAKAAVLSAMADVLAAGRESSSVLAEEHLNQTKAS